MGGQLTNMQQIRTRKLGNFVEVGGDDDGGEDQDDHDDHDDHYDHNDNDDPDEC